MSIVYDPTSLLKKIAPASKIKRLLTKTLSLKRAALSFVDAVDFINKKSVTRVALNVVQSYKKRIDEDETEKAVIAADPKLLVQRVQNEVITQISQEIGVKYDGEQYTWLPSSAAVPDPLHQLNYGKVFTIGDGEKPGDRYGCQCGMEILTEGKSLNL